jgi:hypothetical protein
MLFIRLIKKIPAVEIKKYFFMNEIKKSMTETICCVLKSALFHQDTFVSSVFLNCSKRVQIKSCFKVLNPSLGKGIDFVNISKFCNS